MYYFAFGYNFVANQWYTVILHCTSTVTAGYISTPLQMFTVSTDTSDSIIYDIGTNLGVMYIPAQVTAQNLKVSLSLQNQAINTKSAGIIYTLFADITPSLDSSEIGAYFYFEIN